MQSQKTYGEQNPTAVWQGSWAELIKQVIIQMTECNYIGAWDTMLMLQVLIPPECEEETKKFYRRTEKVLFDPVGGYDRIAAIKFKQRQIQREAPQAIRELISEVRKSLFSKGWINKEFSIKPLQQERPHIRSDA